MHFTLAVGDNSDRGKPKPGLRLKRLQTEAWSGAVDGERLDEPDDSESEGQRQGQTVRASPQGLFTCWRPSDIPTPVGLTGGSK